VYDGKRKMSDTWPMALLVMVSAIVIAWLCLKFYDEPVRKWLRKKMEK
jgi:peptidoglycan/LPS O-acetylase OafA/YrhL